MEYLKRERITAISVISLAMLVLFYVVPNYIETTEVYEMTGLSPSFFPELALWFIIGLAFLYFCLSFNKKYQPAPERDTDEWLSPGEEWQAILSGIIIIGYLLLMKLVGFLIATPLALLCLFLLQGVRDIFKMVVTIIVCTLGVYLLFFYIMHVHFPTGLLFE